MSRRVAAIAAVLDEQLRNRELRDRGGQAQRIAVALAHPSGRATMGDVIAGSIDSAFLKANKIQKEEAIAVFLAARKEIEVAMATSDDSTPTYNVNVSGVVGPVNVLGNHVTQSQTIHAGDADWLRAELQKLGFDPSAAQTHIGVLDGLAPSDRTVSKVKRIARAAAVGALSLGGTAGATGLGGVLTTLFLQYMGLQ